MAKPTRYTAAAILAGTAPEIGFDLAGYEVRQANRMAGRTTWYREVLIKRVGVRHVATGRPVDAEGNVGQRVQFAEGPGHQTYEVREQADIDVPVTRAAIFQMRAMVRRAIASGSRIAVNADDVDDLFYAELGALIRMIRADAELLAYDDLDQAAEADVAEAVAATAPQPAADKITWTRLGRGYYVATDGEAHDVGVLAALVSQGLYTIRMDPNASEANRWVLRRGTTRVSAHRLLKHAKRAGQTAHDRDVATARAAAAAGVTGAVATGQTPDITGAVCVETKPHPKHIIIGSFRGGCPGIPDQPARVLDATTELARSLVTADHEQALVEAAERAGAHVRDNCPALAIGGCERCTAPATVARIRTALIRQGDIVTITPRGERQFEVLGDVDLDDMVRVYPVRPRCEHDGQRWVGTTYVRHVPAIRAEKPWDVEADGDDPQYDAACPGHPAVAAIDQPDPLRDPAVLNVEVTSGDELAFELRNLADRAERTGPEGYERLASELRALAELRMLRVDVVRCEAHSPGELHYERPDCQYPHLASPAERIMFTGTDGTRLT